ADRLVAGESFGKHGPQLGKMFIHIGAACALVLDGRAEEAVARTDVHLPVIAEVPDDAGVVERVPATHRVRRVAALLGQVGPCKPYLATVPVRINLHQAAVARPDTEMGIAL